MEQDTEHTKVTNAGPVDLGYVWRSANDTPGATLPPEVEGEMRKKIVGVTEAQQRAYAKGRSYSLS